MTHKEETQLGELLICLKRIFKEFDIFEIHKLMDCVVDSYELTEQTLQKYKERSQDVVDERMLNIFQTLLGDKAKLLKKLHDMQKDMAGECTDFISTDIKISRILKQLEPES